MIGYKGCTALSQCTTKSTAWVGPHAVEFCSPTQWVEGGRLSEISKGSSCAQSGELLDCNLREV